MRISDWSSDVCSSDLDAVDRKYLLKDLTNLIAQEDAHVLSIRSDSGRPGQQRLHLQVRVQDFGELSRLLGKSDSLPGVERTRRAQVGVRPHMRSHDGKVTAPLGETSSAAPVTGPHS